MDRVTITCLRMAIMVLALFVYSACLTEASARVLESEVSPHQGYYRLILKWADGEGPPPEFTAQLDNGILRLRFDPDTELDLQRLETILADQIVGLRKNSQNGDIRIALSNPDLRVRLSYSLDRTAIDFIEANYSGVPPDIISPLIEQRRRAAEEAARQAEAIRLANLPPPLPVEVRASEAGGRTKIAFYWPEWVNYKFEQNGLQAKIEFARRGIENLDQLSPSGPGLLDGFQSRNTIERYEATLGFLPDTRVKHYREGNVVIVDLTADLTNPPDPAFVENEKPIPPPGLKPALSVQTTPYSTTAPDEAVSSYNNDSTKAPPKTDWSSALPSSGRVRVEAISAAEGMQITIPWADEMPSAIFTRNNAVWISFPTKVELDLTRTRPPSGYQMQVVEGDIGIALRIEVPEKTITHARWENKAWRIRLGPMGVPPEIYLRPRRTSSSQGARIETDITNAAAPVTFNDPVIGDRLVAITAFPPISALTSTRNFVEANFPVSAHGLAVIPRADDIGVSLNNNLVIVSRPSGLTLSAFGIGSDESEKVSIISPAFTDFDTWARGDPSTYAKSRQTLELAAVRNNLTQEASVDALLDLARFYIAWDLAPEALGPLRLAVELKPELDNDAHLLGLRGAANIIMGRYEEGLKQLNRSAVRADPAGALWRGYAYGELGDWAKAREAFFEGEELIANFTPRWAARFHVAAARANLKAGDIGGASRHANRADALGDNSAQALAQLILAEILILQNDVKKAVNRLSQLAGHPEEKVAVLAEAALIRMSRMQDSIDIEEMVERLEGLRYRWRGDAIEIETVMLLSDAYMAQSRYREAIDVGLKTTTRYPDMPGSRDIRLKLSDHFRALYLDGKADALDPIRALALFYEFRDLTPIGADGDRMIRKLANRLIAFDLLEPAADLLSHQVAKRVKGQAKAQIASDLAAIYLMDKKPEQALDTLNQSRQIGLTEKVRIQRLILEAAAHLDLGRYDHAIELVQDIETTDGADLLANIYWRARKWDDAAKAFQQALPEADNLTTEHYDKVMRTAIAFRLAENRTALRQLRQTYFQAMLNTAQAETFDLLTGDTNISGADLSDAVRDLADTSTASAFVQSLKDRFSDEAG